MLTGYLAGRREYPDCRRRWRYCSRCSSLDFPKYITLTDNMQDLCLVTIESRDNDRISLSERMPVEGELILPQF